VAHSTWIALGLIALFFVYVTAKGELGQYLSTVFGPFPTGSGTGGSGALGSATSAISGASGLAGSVTNLISQGQALAGGLGGTYGSGSGTGGL
jgi:hypothetical protein